MLQNQFQDVSESSFPKLRKESDQGVWASWEDTDGDGFVDKSPSYGITWGDVNGDGYLDLWLNGHFGDIADPPPSLFVNNQDGTFSNQLEQIMQPDSTGSFARGDRHGAVWADIDNDGDQDLIQLVGLIATNEPSKNKLFINEGGVLVNKADELGVSYAQGRSRDAVIFDFNNDGLLDFIHGALTDGSKNPELPATVFQQNPDGTFSDVGAAVDFEYNRSYGLEYVALADFTGDGRLDVFQKQPNALYDVSSGKFVNITNSVFSGVDLQNDRGLIDLAIADFNGDLIPDLFLPTSGGNGHQLILSAQTGPNSSRVWEDKSVESGVRSVSYQTTDGGGVVAADLDNDMDQDMVVLDRTGGTDYIFENQGDGTFVARAFSATKPLQSVPRLELRSVSVADYNNDGFLDLLETTSQNDPTYRLLENTGNGNNWILIDLEGTVSNRDGIGATVYVTAGGVTQMRQQTNGQHHRVQNDTRLHFGLGTNSIISEIRIKWPSGIEQVLNNVNPNQVFQVMEAESQFVATDDAVTTSLSTAIDIQVLANDSTASETSFTLSANDSNNGSVAVNNNGTADSSDDFITYTPDAGFAGTDSFTYEINDGNGATDTATVNVTVISGNLPVATDDSVVVAEDSQITLDVLSNDTDVDNDSLILDSVTPGSEGTTTIVNNQVVYTPDANFNGTDSFNYTVTDGNGGSATATVNLTVTGVNDGPVANNDTVTAEQNTAVQVPVLTNDTDIDGDTLEIISIGPATNGTASISDNQIVYTPNADFLGIDAFTYEISDGNGGTDTAIVNVTITEPAIRVEDGLLSLYTFDAGSGNTVFDVSGVGDPLNLEIDTTTGVTGNNGSQVTCSCGSCQTCNSQVNWGDGVLNVYSHSLIASNEAATKLSDGIKETQEVTIEAWIKSNSLNQRGPARIATLSADSGNRNFTLGQQGDDYQVRLRTSTTGNNGVGKTVTSTGAEVTTEFNHVVYSRDASGLASLFVNNQLVGSETIGGDLLNWNAGYQFALANELDSTRHWLGSYDLVAIYNQAFDADDVDQNYRAGASITIPPIPTPTNALPVAIDDNGIVEENAQITLDVLSNDSDADNDSLSLVSVLPGNSGTTSIVGNQVLYTPNADFFGTDSFTYDISDGNGGSSTATVTVMVTEEIPPVVNEAPIANDDAVTTDENTPVQVQVLANDTDTEGDALTIVSASAGANGSTSIDNNQILYTPNADFFGTDSFTYNISDGNGEISTATVTVTVAEEIPPVVNEAPVANDDAVITDENTPVQIQVLANDTDTENDALTIDSVSAGANGSTSIDNNQILYTPNADFFGTDSFTYDISDGNGEISTATVTVTVAEEIPPVVNEAPIANDDAVITDENTPVQIQVLANDTDTEGDALTIVSASAGANGSTSIDNNQILYTPNVDFFGTDSFTYDISDGNGEISTATVTVTVAEEIPSVVTNTTPVANDDAVTTDENTPVQIQVLANDTDTENDALTIDSVSAGTNGSTSIDNNQILYTPNADFFGTDSFTYDISDDNGGTSTATVTVTVAEEIPPVVNEAPIANDDAVITDENTPVQVQVLANDTDTENDPLTIDSVSAGANGSTSIDNNQILYTPNADFFGTDSFSYDISDDNGGTSTATVTVTVNRPDNSGNSGERVEDGLLSLYTFDEGSGNTVFDVSGIGNPLDLQIDTLNGISWGDGILSVNAPNLIASNQAATKLIDGITQTQELTIEAWITPDNLNQRGPARIATLSAGASTRNVTLGQDRDDYQVRLRTTTTGNNGVRKTVTSSGAEAEIELSHVVYSRDANGLANLFVDNQLVSSNTIDGNFSNWNAGYQFALANELGGGRPWTGSYDQVAIYNQAFDASEVEQNYLAGALNDDDSTNEPTNTLPVAVDDNGTVDEDSQITLDVLSNDTDADNDSLSLVSVLPGNNGTTSIIGNQVLYAPDADFNGTDSFSYTVSDGKGGTDSATVNITVTPVDDAPVPTNTVPVANDDAVTTEENTAVQIQVLANDTDTENDALTIDSVSAGANGSTSIDNNQILYTPNADFFGTDSFNYVISDGNGGTNTATVTVTVTEETPPVVTNTAPVANDDSVTTDQNVAVQVQVLTNDSDADSDALNVVSASAGGNGSTLIENNQVLYTPNADFFGTDSFTYDISDGNGGTDTATVTVTVTQAVDSGSGGRVENGLLSLYTFDEGSGSTVFDVSGVGNALNLEIDTLTGISWGDGVLDVNAPNLIASNQAATKLIDGITQTQELTIEAWITPDNLTQRGPARIASLSANSGNRNVTLGQDKDDYQVRLRTTTTGNNGVRKTVSSSGAQVNTDDLSHVVYSRDANGLANIYVDNQLVGSNTIDGDFSTWNDQYQFALANELDGGRAWLGSYDLVAVYNQAFDASEVEQNYLAGADTSSAFGI